jgi:hypothetical protein
MSRREERTCKPPLFIVYYNHSGTISAQHCVLQSVGFIFLWIRLWKPVRLPASKHSPTLASVPNPGADVSVTEHLKLSSAPDPVSGSCTMPLPVTKQSCIWFNTVGTGLITQPSSWLHYQTTLSHPTLLEEKCDNLAALCRTLWNTKCT